MILPSFLNKSIVVKRSRFNYKLSITDSMVGFYVGEFYATKKRLRSKRRLLVLFLKRLQYYFLM